MRASRTLYHIRPQHVVAGSLRSACVGTGGGPTPARVTTSRVSAASGEHHHQGPFQPQPAAPLSTASHAAAPHDTEMEYRNLGTSGLKISALSLGSWITFGSQVFDDEAFRIMSTAYDAGINFFDNAESYAHGRSELVMGEILRRAGWRRESLIISTKLYWGEPESGRMSPNDRGLSRKHIVEGMNNSLKRLGLDYVDLVYCHRPDKHTPIEETVRAMSHLVSKGQALYWGTSEWSALDILDAWHIAKREGLVPPTMEQPEYSMLTRHRIEKEYKPLYDRIGLGTTIWSPLKFGILTGKYLDNIPDDSRVAQSTHGKRRIMNYLDGAEGQNALKAVRALKPIADQLNCSLAQLALAWCLKNPHVSSVITGASRVSQVHENIASLRVSRQIDGVLMKEIDIILDNKPAEDHDWRIR